MPIPEARSVIGNWLERHFGPIHPPFSYEQGYFASAHRERSEDLTGRAQIRWYEGEGCTLPRDRLRAEERLKVVAAKLDEIGVQYRWFEDSYKFKVLVVEARGLRDKPAHLHPVEREEAQP